MSENKFNQDELVPPSFINESYILEFLRKAEEDPQLFIINHEIVPGSAAGDHYASIMFKIIVSYGSKGSMVKDRRFILKTVPEAEGLKKEMLEQLPIFKNEIMMYTKVLPAMEKILAKHNEKRFWPTLVYHQEQPFVLIFDDLTMENYGVSYAPMKLDRLEMIVEKLAKYHAMSAVLVQNGMPELTKVKIPFNEGMVKMFAPLKKLMAGLAKVVESWEGYEELGRKLAAHIPNSFDLSMKATHRDNSGEFQVLTHGDFHIRNMMFKKDQNGNLNEVLFLDFQAPQYSIPSFDLIGLINTMGDFEVRKNDDEVLKMYHKKLVDNLKLYGFKRDFPAFVDIKIGMLRLSPHYLMSALLVGPMFSVKDVELGEFFKMEHSPELKKALNILYEEESFKDNVKMILEKFDKIGALDVLN